MMKLDTYPKEEEEAEGKKKPIPQRVVPASSSSMFLYVHRDHKDY